MSNFRQIKAREAEYKKQLLAINPNLDDKSGIYLLTREEDGIKYAYIGQAKHILTRLAQHLSGYQQHIDLSLKKHGLFSASNPNGWKVTALHYPINMLDEMEQEFIRKLAGEGFQLRNKTGGSQGTGKRQIDEYKPPKGYRDGLAQGYKNAVNELRNIIEKHLTVSIREGKEHNKISIKAFEKFKSILYGEE